VLSFFVLIFITFNASYFNKFNKFVKLVKLRKTKDLYTNITIITDIINMEVLYMGTTIAISTDMRDQIKEFGNKGETYEQILARLVASAKERQLQEILMDKKGTVPIQVALEKAKKRWQK